MIQTALKCIRVTLIISLVCSFFPYSPVYSQEGNRQDPTSPATTPTDVDASLDEMLQRVQSLSPLIEELNSGLDRSQFNLDALSDSLNDDPITMIDFVRREIAFQQYQGVLRGEVGTLIGHSGNAVDQALLLRYLLESAGYETRIAHATLSFEQAETLVGQMLLDISAPKNALDQTAFDALVQRHLEVGSSTTSDPNADQAKIYEEVTEQDVKLITDTLAMANITLNNTNDIDKIIREAQDYYWVQYRRSAFDEWIDAHPAFVNADAAPIDLSPEETHRDTLPENIYHRLRLELFIEQKRGDELIVHPLLTDWERTVAELVGKPITFQNQPNNFDPEQLTEMDTLLTNTRLFLPMINGEFAPTAFDLNGNPFGIALASSNSISVTLLFQTAGDVFEDLTGALDNVAATETNAEDIQSLTAQWIEYTLIAPGGQELTSRRYLIDRIGEQNRESGTANFIDSLSPLQTKMALVTSHTIMVLPTEYDPAYRANRILERLINEIEFLDYLEDATGLTTPLKRLMSELIPLDDVIFDAASVSPDNPERNLVRYVPEPMLVVYQNGIVPDRRTQTGFERVDIINNTRRIFDTDGSTLLPAISETIRQGIWDTYAEQALIRNSTGQSFNTFTALERAADASILLIVLTPDRLSELDALPYNEATRYALERDLEAGYFVLIPEVVTGDTGWWRIDPESGETLGMVSGGYGQEFVEYLGALSNTTFFFVGMHNCTQGGGSLVCCYAVNGAGLALGMIGGLATARMASAVANMLIWDYYWNLAGYYAPSPC